METVYHAVGIDFGSQKTMVVADDGEIVRTDTGKTLLCISFTIV